MLFNSFAFAVFLPIVFVTYWLLPQRTPRIQNAFLIAASCLFYGWWDYRFLSLLFISSYVDYTAGKWLEHQANPKIRRWLLGASLGTNLSILGFFKYFGFFVHSFEQVLTHVGLHADINTLNIILPVGLSFYTFQSMAYTIDVYRGHLKPARNWIDFFAFVSFFPQLVAGPIQRAGYLLSQFQQSRELKFGQVRRGAEQVLWGLFKKVVIADNLAGPVEQIFVRHTTLGSATLLCGTIFFAVQIYCDFSGYSDIAIGTASFFGVTLTRNFAYPYFACNLVEFWQRWHISLSTWFRDYLYIPLGGNRVGSIRRQWNLLATFVISGLWHGANWTFIAWGFFHGLLYVAYIAFRGKASPKPDTGSLLPSLRQCICLPLTFLTILISWVFFRANSIGAALSYLTGLATRLTGGKTYIETPILVEALILSAGLLLIEWCRRTKSHALDLGDISRLIRWPLYYAVIGLILWKGNFNYVPFIYFNF
jgi:D-alanyl-lipoteichoic acid acyltransferase DltB (MBOAT superfamily)